MATYVYQSSFRNGIALVKNAQERYGFIDEQGKEIVPCKYDAATMFSGNTARISRDGLWGAVGKDGKILIPVRYNELSHAIGGRLYAVKDGKTGIFNDKGKRILPCEYEYIEEIGEYYLACTEGVDREGNIAYFYAVYDAVGKCLIRKGLYTEATQLNNGALLVGKNGKYGVVRLTGEVIIPVKYEQIDATERGMYIIYRKELYGLLNEKGEEVLPIAYQSIYEPYREQNGEYITAPLLIIQNTENLSGATDAAGKEVLPCLYEVVNVGHEDRLTARKAVNDTYEAIVTDYTGKVLSPKGFSSIDFLSFGGYAVGRTKDANELFGVADEKFKIIVEPAFSFISVANSGETLIVAGLPDENGATKQGLFHLPTRKMRYPFEADNLSHFITEGNHYFLCQKGNLYGVLNENGEEYIPVSFTKLDLVDGERGWFATEDGGKMGVIDVHRQIVAPFEYDSVDVDWDYREVNAIKRFFFDKTGKPVESPYLRTTESLEFNDGVAIVMYQGQYCYLNEQFELIAPLFEHAYSFQHGLGLARGEKGWGFLNAKGEWVVPAEHHDIGFEYSKTHFCAYTEDGFYSLHSFAGGMVLDKVATEAMEFLESWVRYRNYDSDIVLYNVETGKSIKIPKTELFLFKEGAALACQTKRGKSTYYFIDEQGNKLFDVSVPHTNAESFLDGYAVFIDEKKNGIADYYIVNKKGKVTLELKNCDYFARLTGTCYLVSTEGKNYLYAPTGKQLTTQSFVSANVLTQQYLFLHSTDEQGVDTYSVFNLKSESAKKLPFDYVYVAYDYERYPNSEPKLTVGKLVGDAYKYGLADVQGKLLFSCQYDNLSFPQKGGYVIAQKGDQYGAITSKNEVLVPFEYQSAITWSEDLIVMREVTIL